MNQPHVSSAWQSILSGLPKGAALPPRPVKSTLEIHPFRRWLGPLLLMLSTPFLSIMMWMTAAYFDGSILAFFRAGPGEWLSRFPKPSLKAVIIILAWMLAQWGLLRYLPGRTGEGPITPTGKRPTYKYNGPFSWVVTHGLLFGIFYPLGILNPAKLYPLYGSLLITLNLGALCVCILLYIKGRCIPSSTDAVYSGSLLFDFFQGIELYPMMAGTSLKQLINCRVSMMGWSVIALSFLVSQWDIHGAVTPSMIASVAILVVYLFKFFVWERGYLYSTDIMHDRFGYYICWGVLVWVPSLYCLAAFYLVDHGGYLNPLAAAVVVILGIVSIGINFDADRQRQRIRDKGAEVKIWGKTPRIIHARYTTSDSETHTNPLLASGWWGMARHFHYVPELMLAAAWTIPAGFRHLLPWFYLIFLFILLMDRAGRDEKRCALKYGEYWQEYRNQVKYKVFPGIF